MTSLKKSVGVSVITQYAEVGIQFVGVLILARLITPEESGTYSVAAFLMAILHVFRDFGVGKYLIREETLTPQKIRSTLGVAIILAWTVALVMLASSQALADFYGNPGIRAITLVMAASFAVSPIGSVFTSLFRRDLQMKKIFIVRVVSALCHVTTAVTLGYRGHGAMSLAWANFAGILSFGLAAHALRSPSTPWLPSFRHLREILSFGGVSSLGTLATTAGNGSPDIIIGKMISLEAAGYFSRANGLLSLFRTLVSGAVGPLVLPYFSQLKRAEGDVNAPYHAAVEYLTVFAWPFFAVTALLATQIVRTLYGPNWDMSIPVVQVLCLAGAIGTLATFAAEVMIAYGHVASVTRMQMALQLVRVVLIVASCPFGLTAIAASLVLSECVSLAITSSTLKKAVGVRLSQVVHASGKSALVTLASCIAPVAALLLLPDAHRLTVLGLGATGAALGWLLAVAWCGHPMDEHLRQARRLFSRKGS